VPFKGLWSEADMWQKLKLHIIVFTSMQVARYFQLYFQMLFGEENGEKKSVESE
jgi:hypothetical protein